MWILAHERTEGKLLGMNERFLEGLTDNAKLRESVMQGSNKKSLSGFAVGLHNAPDLHE